MHLTHKENDLIFAIMRDLTKSYSHIEIRKKIGHQLLMLLNADYFASFIWDKTHKKFISCTQINMCPDNLKNYNEYFQFCDPITPALQNRRRATLVNDVMAHERLIKTEFYNDFLRQDGLCYGINFFSYFCGVNIGDIRIWRNNTKEDFGNREREILDAIAPSFTNALIRSLYIPQQNPRLGFTQISHKFLLTNREVEVADLVSLGHSDQEICKILSIAKPTLRSHIKTVFTKIKTVRRTQLAALIYNI